MTVEKQEEDDHAAVSMLSKPRSGLGVEPVWRKHLRRHLPICQWFTTYRPAYAVADLVAGMTLGLTMIPQSIAYAALAGLAPQYGLYSTFMGSFVYVIMGTVKEVSIGPTSLMALLTFEFTQDLPYDYVVLLTFAAGAVELLMGLLRLGFLVDFISSPVTCGFQSATAAIIIASQLKGLLGLRKFKPGGFFQSVVMTIERAWSTRMGDAALGLICCIMLLLLRKLKDCKICGEKKALSKILWFVSISRNALVVVLSSIAAFFYESSGHQPFLLSGNVTSGLPPFQLPPLSGTQVGNQTTSFVEMLDEIKMGVFILPLVAVLANVTIAKAFSGGQPVDATQEMITLGVCNMAGSLISAMPTCGAFTRSAVSNSSGVRTPLAGLFSGCLILMVLSFLTPYFCYIPRASLAAVLICAVIFMFDYRTMMMLWRANKRDFACCTVTLSACLTVGVELGLLIGITINICQLLYLWARPSINVSLRETPRGGYYLVQPDVGLTFPAVDFVRAELQKKCPDAIPVVIDCLHFKWVDFTCAQGIGELVKEFSSRGRQLLLINMTSHVHNTLQIARVNLPYALPQPYEKIEDILFTLPSSPSALLLSDQPDFF